MTVKRRKYGTGHAYYVDDEKYPGVTTVLGMLPKDGLIGWAARATAEYAIDYWDELARLRLSQRLNKLRKAMYEDRDAAGHRGTEVHRLARHLIAGEEVIVPDELAGHVEAYTRFLDQIEPEPVATELIVVNKTLRYCGTSDLVADLPEILTDDGEVCPPARWLLELKTTRSGVWPESAIQATAYQRAEFFVDPASPEEERPMDWLRIARCGVVWVTSEGWELRPVDTGETAWEIFQRLRWLFDHQDDLKGLIGAAALVPVLAPAAS